MHKMAAFNKKNYLLVSALSTSLSILLLLIKKETLAQVFSCDFCQISKNTFYTEHSWAIASILREGRRLKQIEISIISKLHKENDKKNKNVLTFLIFYLCSSFFFSGFAFYKEALCFICLYFHHYLQTC